MIHAIEHLAKALKNAREDKNLSQRALSQRTGIPQGQISKIENATVDLRASTLIELARALDLELMLVPRKHVTSVSSVIGAGRSSVSRGEGPRPAYMLDDEEDDHA